ncbi:MAG TPA: hypothetical protein VKZ18_16650 [Polyangia bacterium]|nr:hypothetical protein [Polyangia bacterium]
MPTIVSPVSSRATSARDADSRLEIDATRARQTDRPSAPFRDVLAGGVGLLMSGAEIATHVVAGPVMAAAVHDARVGTTSAIAGPRGGGAEGAAGSAGTPAEPASVQTMLQDGQASNMQMLALQQQIQEESQRFTTVSNVMRAKYDTAKAAVSNIRA